MFKPNFVGSYIEGPEPDWNMNSVTLGELKLWVKTFRTVRILV